MKINRHKLNLLAGFCLLLMVSLACECEHSQEIKGPGGVIYSTANISKHSNKNKLNYLLEWAKRR